MALQSPGQAVLVKQNLPAAPHCLSAERAVQLQQEGGFPNLPQITGFQVSLLGLCSAHFVP